MHIRRALFVCLLIGLFATQANAQFRRSDPAPGENFHIELGLMFWKPTPGIVIGSSSLSTVSGAGLDVVETLDIADKRFNEFRGVIKLGKNKLRVSHVNMTYNETNTLTQTIVVGGRPFSGSATATGDLQWELWRVGYEHDFVATDRGLFGIVTELNFNHVVADLSASASGFTSSSLTDEKVPFPALGVIGRVYPHKNVGVTVEWTGFKMPGFIANKLTDTDNGEAHMKDFDIYVTGSFTRYFGVQGGYRALTADYILDSDTGDFEMKGVYFGAMVRF